LWTRRPEPGGVSRRGIRCLTYGNSAKRINVYLKSLFVREALEKHPEVQPLHHQNAIFFA